MQKIPEQKLISKKALLLIAASAILSAALLSLAIWLGANKISSSAAANELKLARDIAQRTEEINISGDLRKVTVDYVFKKEAIPNYSYDQIWTMDVSKPSGVTAEDLKLVTQGGLVGLEDAFLKGEQDYGVNCLFVMAIASLESANGTICFRPNNMFGFGGSGFSSKAEGIDVVSRALANNYLSPGGSLYNGTRISDVNKRYAASSTWDEKVCRNMARYYSVISEHHNAQLKKLK